MFAAIALPPVNGPAGQARGNQILFEPHKFKVSGHPPASRRRGKTQFGFDVAVAAVATP